MSGDIISLLQLDKHSNTNTTITVVKDHTGSDGSFITSCLMGHCIKNKSPTILILLHQSLGHYHNVGLRMFYNLKKSIDTGLIQICDFNTDHIDSMINGKYISIDQQISYLEKKFKLMQEKHGSVNIIVDGLSHLFDMGHSLAEVNQYCKEIIKHARQGSNSFVVFSCNIAFDEDLTNAMANLLSHKATTVLEVKALSSGWSSDVSGHLTVSYPCRKFDEEHQNILDPKPVNYHFKLFEKGVKMFAPGTI